jgi:hypothetical protein
MEMQALYNRLMEQRDLDGSFCCHKANDNVLLFTERSKDGKQIFMVNTCSKKVYEIRDEEGMLVAFTKDDVDFDVVGKMAHNDDAYKMRASHFFHIDDFNDGHALVQWNLYDGDCCADTNDVCEQAVSATSIFALIDENCNVVIPFTDMHRSRKSISASTRKWHEKHFKESLEGILSKCCDDFMLFEQSQEKRNDYVKDLLIECFGEVILKNNVFREDDNLLEGISKCKNVLVKKRNEHVF